MKSREGSQLDLETVRIRLKYYARWCQAITIFDEG